MKCKYNRKLAAYQLGALCRVDHGLIRDHLRDCPACRQELAALKATTELLQPMAQHDAPPQTWSRVQSRLTTRRRQVSPARQWTPAFAAVILLVVVAMVMLPSLHAPVQTGILDSDGYAQVQLAAAWDNPLADKAALGLALIAVEDEGLVTPTTEGLD